VRRHVLGLLILLLVTSLTHVPPLFTVYDGETAYHYTSKIIYINRGSSNLVLGEDFRSAPLFPNSSWQKTYLLSVNQPYATALDLDQNKILLLDLPPLLPNENITFSYSLHVVRADRPIPHLTIHESGDLGSIPRELDEYCEAEGSWLVEDEALRALAREIRRSTENSTNVLEIAISLVDWIGKHVEPISHDRPLYPNETYTLLQGDCDDQSNLLITLCRILQIPAYLQVGCIRNPGAPKETTYWNSQVTSVLKNLGYHAWALIYVPPWGWLPFDVTLAWEASNPLAVITSAKVWKRDTIVIFDVVHSDWAGLGRRQKDHVISSSLNIYLEDALELDDPGTEVVFWESPSFWIGAFAILLLIGGYVVLRRFS